MTDYVYSPAAKKRVAVKTLNPTGKPSKHRAREAELWIKLPLRVLEMSRAMSGTARVLLILLVHLKFEARSSTFPLPNGFLERYGISRFMKCRALAELEVAGFITFQGPLRKSPTVTLLLDL